jgi:hypothetical protein
MYAGVFAHYDRVAVKAGEDESHVFDARDVMTLEALEIERVTGLTWGQWQRDLCGFSVTAVAGLLHVLRKRDGQDSDWPPGLKVTDLTAIPLHDDDSEYTAGEVRDDLERRVAEAQAMLDAAAAASPELAAAMHDTAMKITGG